MKKTIALILVGMGLVIGLQSALAEGQISLTVLTQNPKAGEIVLLQINNPPEQRTGVSITPPEPFTVNEKTKSERYIAVTPLTSGLHTVSIKLASVTLTSTTFTTEPNTNTLFNAQSATPLEMKKPNLETNVSFNTTYGWVRPGNVWQPSTMTTSNTTGYKYLFFDASQNNLVWVKKKNADNSLEMFKNNDSTIMASGLASYPAISAGISFWTNSNTEGFLDIYNSTATQPILDVSSDHRSNLAVSSYPTSLFTHYILWATDNSTQIKACTYKQGTDLCNTSKTLLTTVGSETIQSITVGKRNVVIITNNTLNPTAPTSKIRLCQLKEPESFLATSNKTADGSACTNGVKTLNINKIAKNGTIANDTFAFQQDTAGFFQINIGTFTKSYTGNDQTTVVTSGSYDNLDATLSPSCEQSVEYLAYTSKQFQGRDIIKLAKVTGLTTTPAIASSESIEISPDNTNGKTNSKFARPATLPTKLQDPAYCNEELPPLYFKEDTSTTSSITKLTRTPTNSSQYYETKLLDLFGYQNLNILLGGINSALNVSGILYFPEARQEQLTFAQSAQNNGFIFTSNTISNTSGYTKATLRLIFAQEIPQPTITSIQLFESEEKVTSAPTTTTAAAPTTTTAATTTTSFTSTTGSTVSTTTATSQTTADLAGATTTGNPEVIGGNRQDFTDSEFITASDFQVDTALVDGAEVQVLTFGLEQGDPIPSEVITQTVSGLISGSEVTSHQLDSLSITELESKRDRQQKSRSVETIRDNKTIQTNIPLETTVEDLSIQNIVQNETLFNLDTVLGLAPKLELPIWGYLIDDSGTAYFLGKGKVNPNHTYALQAQNPPDISGEVTIMITQIENIESALNETNLYATVTATLLSKEEAVNVKPELNLYIPAQNISLYSGQQQIELRNKGTLTGYTTKDTIGRGGLTIRVEGEYENTTTKPIQMAAMVKGTQSTFSTELVNDSSFKTIIEISDPEVKEYELILSASTEDGIKAIDVRIPLLLASKSEQPKASTAVFTEMKRTNTILSFILIIIFGTFFMFGLQLPLLGKLLTRVMLGILIILVAGNTALRLANELITSYEENGFITLPTTDYTVVVSSLPKSNNPFSIVPAERFKLSKIYEPLVKLNEDLQPESALALSWSMMDENTWELKLRSDVFFHNGQRFSANDVVSTLKAIQETNSATRAFTSNIRQINVVNESRILFITKTPDPLLIYKLSYINIISNADAATITEQLVPNGTGEYRYLAEHSSELVLIKNKAYHSSTSGSPYTNIIIKEIINKYAKKDIATAQMANEIQGIPIDIMEDITLANYTINEKTSTSALYVMFNTNTKSLGDRDFRKMIVEYVNTKAISETMDQKTFSITQFSNPGILGYEGKISQQNSSTNSEDLRKQLAEKIASLNANSGSTLISFTKEYARTASAIQSAMAEVGMELTLNELKPREYIKELKEGFEGMYLLNIVFALGDSTEFIENFIWSEGNYNHGNYSNSRVDEEFLKSKSLFSVLERSAKLRKIQTIITVDDPAGIPILGISNINALKNEPNYSLTDKTLLFLKRS